MTAQTKKNVLINAAFYGLILLIVYFFFQYLIVWLLPFLIGLVCALVLQKPLALLTKVTPFSKGVWTLILVGGLAAVLFGGVAYGGYVLYDRLFLLVDKAADLVPLLKDSVSALLERFSYCTQKLPPSLVARLQTTPGELAGQAVSYVSRLLTDLAADVVLHLPSLILTTVVSVAACFFMTAEYPKITRFLLQHVPPPVQAVLCKTKQVFTCNILKMLRGYALVMGLTFIELFFGLLILRIPYASTLALLIAVVDILPVLGTGTVLLPWGAVALFVGNNRVAIGVFVLYVVITVLRNVLEPKIIGKQVGLPPLVTLLAMYLGLNLFGFAGLWGLPLILIVLAKLQESGMIRIWKEGSHISASVAEEQKAQQNNS